MNITEQQYVYVAEQLSIMAGAPVEPTEYQAARFWAALSREEEHGAGTDAHGNYPHTASWLTRLGLLEQPPLNQEVAELCARRDTAPPKWPKGHRFAACLTHDVDRIVKLPWRERWRQLAAVRGTATVKQMARWAAGGAVYALSAACGQSDLATFDFWLDEEARFGFRSTFFVLPEQLAAPTTYDHYYRYGDRITFRGQHMPFQDAARLVRASGWEVGLHGSYASALATQIMRAEKAQVEEMLDAPIMSVRQHFLRYNSSITPLVQAHSGFQADSTLGYSDTIGCRTGLSMPYFLPVEGDLLEAPLMIQDVGLLRGRESRQAYDGALARARALLTRIADTGGLVTLSWHTHPESPGACECYRALLETIADLGGWGCSLGELNHWWRMRRAHVFREQDPASAGQKLAWERLEAA